MDASRFQGLRFDHIRTQELALLVRCAEASGFGGALHTLAYRAELRRRADEAMMECPDCMAGQVLSDGYDCPTCLNRCQVPAPYDNDMSVEKRGRLQQQQGEG